MTVGARKKIVVSGIGLVTALGKDRETTWKNLLEGASGILPQLNYPQGVVENFPQNGARSRMGDFVLKCAKEAILHAGFKVNEIKGWPIGCAISQSKPVLVGHGPNNSLDPSLLLASFTGWSSESVVQRGFQLAGPSANAAAACATGVSAIEIGRYWIESGQCRQVLVGASESSLNALYEAGFEQMGVLSQSHDSRMKPFDKNRDGFFMGEGAAVLLIEDFVSANERGHKPICELGAVVMQHSAQDAIRFDSNGEHIFRLLKNTTKDTCLPDYINAHGTATHLNDVVEARGMKLFFRNNMKSIAVSSTKAATGHLLGAAGAVEAAFAALALRDQIAPPLLNLEERDPECDLNFVVGKGRRGKLNSTISLSYGFGGQMGAVQFLRLS